MSFSVKVRQKAMWLAERTIQSAIQRGDLKVMRIGRRTAIAVCSLLTARPTLVLSALDTTLFCLQKEGDWLLQTAAASSVGKLVLQLAQQYRFKTINVIRRREQETIIRNLGGNEVICTEDKDLTARLQELTAGKGVERAIDCVAGELGAEVARNLAPAGTMLMYGALSSHRQTDPAKFTMPLFAPRFIYSTATVRGWWRAGRVERGGVEGSAHPSRPPPI